MYGVYRMKNIKYNCFKNRTINNIHLILSNKKTFINKSNVRKICITNSKTDKHTLYRNENATRWYFVSMQYSTSAMEEHKLLSSVHTTLMKNAADAASVEKQGCRFNYNTQFTHTCGELTLTDVGKVVKLCGWIRYRRMNKFILLWDMHGITQVIINEELKEIALNLPLESTICVEGIVRPRPIKTVNTKYITGEIEVSACSIRIISKASSILPFNITEFNKAREVLLNRYRPLALRFSEFRSNIIQYAKLESKMRQFLDENDFVNIPTPTLFKATPGGAREFVVPTRRQNCFYSLVQSPQQFKQMLMMGSFDRYYQFARCYRDEGTTPERQPEFTQLDIEMSYTTVNGVLKLVEDILRAAWPTDKPAITIPFPRITYEEAINLYGTDKPWILNFMKINDISEFIISNDTDEFCGMIVIPNFSLSNDIIVKKHLYKDVHKTNIFTIQISDDWEAIKTELLNILPLFQIERFSGKDSLHSGDTLLVSRGRKRHVLADLGSIRKNILISLINSKKFDSKTEYEFLWIVDFPLFTETENCPHSLESTHHPFTQPHPDDINLLDSDPLRVRALHYDLVMNGSEIGGGSIRIHDYNLQSKIFKLLKIPEENFTHLIQSMKCGCPSMGGIALGMERLVMLITKARSIRDVIAFPKGSEGQDLMTNAPCDISLEDKLLYHLVSATPSDNSSLKGIN